MTLKPNVVFGYEILQPLIWLNWYIFRTANWRKILKKQWRCCRLPSATKRWIQTLVYCTSNQAEFLQEMLERMQYFKDIVKNERDPKLLQAGASHHQLKSQELVKRRIEHGTKTMLANMKQETLPSAVDLGSPKYILKIVAWLFFSFRPSRGTWLDTTR